LKENKFENIRLITEKEIFNYIPMGHPHRPSTNAILFVKKGKVVLKEFISTYTLSENHFMFIDSNNVYEVIEISDDVEITLLGYQKHFIEKLSVKMNKIQLYKSLKSQLKRNFSLTENQLKTLNININQIDHFLKTNEKYNYINEIIEHCLIMILYQITDAIEVDVKNHYAVMNRNQKIVSDFIFLVSKNYLEHKKVEFYAQKIGITARYMSNIIKSETGKTPQEFITDYIVNEAKAQLSGTAKDIKEIAYNLNFYDQYSFSNFFIKHLGIRPTAYRKQFVNQ
jgi:AraC family transcriptional regulator, transcriptional activator of pobA